MNENLTFTEKLIDFIDMTPSAFHCVENTASILESAGFIRLDASKPFEACEGKKYFLTRGGSSLIAFIIPEDISDISFSIGAVHSDSPALKLKPSCETDAFGKYRKLSVEKYGGAVLNTWFDRPLSVAGRIVVCENGKLVSKNVNIDQDLLIIPSIPPHLGKIEAPSLTVDFLPLFSESSSKIMGAGVISIRRLGHCSISRSARGILLE